MNPTGRWHAGMSCARKSRGALVVEVRCNQCQGAFAEAGLGCWWAELLVPVRRLAKAFFSAVGLLTRSKNGRRLPRATPPEAQPTLVALAQPR